MQCFGKLVWLDSIGVHLVTMTTTEKRKKKRKEGRVKEEGPALLNLSHSTIDLLPQIPLSCRESRYAIEVRD